MWTFIIRRLLQSVIVILGVTLISFISLQMGGDPTYLFVSERASEEEIQMIREALGFDKPLHIQYLTYLWNVAQGEFGNSLSYRQPAMDIVLGALPATIELTIFSMFLAISLAIPFGVFAAIYRGTPLDGSIMTLAMFGQSIPSFWMGIMMILFFGLYLGWFPISGHVPFLTPLFQGDFATAFGNLPQAAYHLFLPASPSGSIRCRATPASCGPRCWKCWGRITSAPPGPRGSASALSS
jgi:peptide/nickel transport system permease protein